MREFLSEAPELAALRMLSSSLSAVIELIDELHDGIVDYDEQPDVVVNTLKQRLAACSSALAVYQHRRVADLFEAEAERRRAEDDTPDDDIF